MLDLKEISYQPQTGERKIIDNLSLKVHENEIIFKIAKKMSIL